MFQRGDPGDRVHRGDRHERSHLVHGQAYPEGAAGTLPRLCPCGLHHQAGQLLAEATHLAGQPQVQV